MRPPNRKGSEVFFMDIQQIISQMTLEEKAALCQGRSSWFTRAVERLGVPEMMMSDGPHGLRKQDLEKENGGVNDAIKAVCYPTAVVRHAPLTGRSWRKWAPCWARPARRKRWA